MNNRRCVLCKTNDTPLRTSIANLRGSLMRNPSKRRTHTLLGTRNVSAKSFRMERDRVQPTVRVYNYMYVFIYLVIVMCIYVCIDR